MSAPDQPDSPPGQRTVKIDFTDPSFDDAVGKTIGPYKILEKVGEGGWGVVYVAEQSKPVQRRVALKVIKLGMDTKAVVARFEAERQALAMMDHPNIAKVLDVGATQEGRPFFVMELVRGIKITDYCDQNNLPTKERLGLFIKVCQAIQHAHQKGIIHRDIKPSNILVTLHDGVAVPKVIDFGIAKATQGRLTEATVYTQLHEFVGTPAYMSPEQAEMSGLDIDTRSDIYSLGVLLYELLTGETPFNGDELVAQGIEGMRKTIREQEPARPSTKLATLAGEELTTTASRRSSDGAKLIHLLKGDLDWIAMKCLEKDRTRRYESANGLAADVQRHLKNEPITARPASNVYRLQKLFRRHKLAVAAAGAVAAALVLGIVATTWQAVRATQAKREALAAKEQAVKAQAEETKLRRQAEVQEYAARQRAYASDMNVAEESLDDDNLGRTLDLLNAQRPTPGQKDLRGWEWRYLWKQTQSDALFTLTRLPHEPSSVAVSGDGRWLAIAMIGDGVRVWDLLSKREVARIFDKEARMARLAFSPTEPLLAVSGRDYSIEGTTKATLRLWNAAAQKTVFESPLSAYCEGLAFSRDGRTLVTSTFGDGDMTLWRVSDGKKLAGYPTHAREFMGAGTAFAATPDLGLAAYGLQNGEICVMNLRTGRNVSTAAGAGSPVYALALSPDGKTLASSGIPESDIDLWDVASGKEIGHLRGHDSFVYSIVFWPDGKRIASSSADQTIRVWDAASRECLDVLRGHRQEVWRLALLPDEKILVSACKDGRICFWDTSVIHPRHRYVTIPRDVRDWVFAPSGRSLTTVNAQGKVSQWSGPEFQTEEALLDIHTNVDHRSVSADVERRLFSPDGNFLVVPQSNGSVAVWDLSHRALLSSFKPPGNDYLWGFTSQGDKLYFSSDNGKFYEWDAAGQREVQSWQATSSFSRWDLIFSPDGRTAVGRDQESHILVRDLISSSPVNRVIDTLGGPEIKFAPDGSRLAMATWAGFVRVWNTATWQEEKTLPSFLNSPLSVAFSPDETRFAAASGGKETLQLWDTASWLEVLKLKTPGSSFWSTFFSPDGNTIASLENHQTLYLWLAPSWEEIAAAEARRQAEAP